jgi:hypothetical protein
MGADEGINYRNQDLTAETRRITGGAGVNVVLDNIGDPVTFPNERSLRDCIVVALTPRFHLKNEWRRPHRRTRANIRLNVGCSYEFHVAAKQSLSHVHPII